MKKINDKCFYLLKKLIKIREVILKYILNTRPTYMIVGLIIGITFTICFKEMNKEEVKIIEIARASDEISYSQDMGELVSADLYLDPNAHTDKTSVESIIGKIFGSQANIALAIAQAESGLKYDAIGKNTNGTLDVGLFQINDIHGHSVEERLDIERNVEIAYELYERDNWTPWVAFNNGSFKKFLK